MKYNVVNSPIETACHIWETNGQVGSCGHQLWTMYTRGFISLTLQKQLQGNIADEDLWESSKYLVDGVFAALQEMFSNARKIQVCAISISFLSNSCYSPEIGHVCCRQNR